jgi:UDP-N-acetylmuramoyl-tripeptide--D-alanyl-D-alanine ligase
MMSLWEVAHLLGGEFRGKDAHFAAVSTDSRQLLAGELFIALQGVNFDGHGFVAAAQERGACGALVERFLNVDLPQIQLADTRLALGRLGAIWRARFQGPLIALTGSNGKTTVKEMIAAILRCRAQVLATQGNLNNDIGVPLTLLRLNAEYAYAVVEMGANHLGEINYLTQLARPDVALVNNAGPAHLEGFGSLDGVAKGKGEIFQGLPPCGIAIINRDDPYADYWSSLANGRRIIDFALDRPAQVKGQVIDGNRNRFQLMTGDQAVAIDLPLPGLHNLRNALAAAAASLAVGANLEDIRRGLEGSQGIAGRLQQLPGPNGSTLINDAYNANPASLGVALSVVSTYPGVKWLVLGDMAELGSQDAQMHAQAGEQARLAGFHRLYTLGKHSLQATLAFGEGSVHCETAEALIQTLAEALRETNERAILLIKGSRRMHMECVIQGLIEIPYKD